MLWDAGEPPTDGFHLGKTCQAHQRIIRLSFATPKNFPRRPSSVGSGNRVSPSGIDPKNSHSCLKELWDVSFWPKPCAPSSDVSRRVLEFDLRGRIPRSAASASRTQTKRFESLTASSSLETCSQSLKALASHNVFIGDRVSHMQDFGESEILAFLPRKLDSCVLGQSQVNSAAVGWVKLGACWQIADVNCVRGFASTAGDRSSSCDGFLPSAGRHGGICTVFRR